MVLFRFFFAIIFACNTYIFLLCPIIDVCCCFFSHCTNKCVVSFIQVYVWQVPVATMEKSPSNTIDVEKLLIKIGFTMHILIDICKKTGYSWFIRIMCYWLWGGKDICRSHNIPHCKKILYSILMKFSQIDLFDGPTWKYSEFLAGIAIF